MWESVFCMAVLEYLHLVFDSCFLKQRNPTFSISLAIIPLCSSFLCRYVLSEGENRYTCKFLDCRLLSLQTNISSNHVVIFIVGRWWIVQCKWKPEYKLLKSCLAAKVHSVLEKHVCFSLLREYILHKLKRLFDCPMAMLLTVIGW